MPLPKTASPYKMDHVKEALSETSSVKSVKKRDATRGDCYTTLPCTRRLASALPYVSMTTLKEVLKSWNIKWTGKRKKTEIIEIIIKALEDCEYDNGFVDFNTKMRGMLGICGNIRARGHYSGLAIRTFPSRVEMDYILKKSAPHNFSYILPSPWIIVKKETPPIVTAYHDILTGLCLSFPKPTVPGFRYLLVALKLYRDADGHLPNYGVLKSPQYRLASINGFACSFGRSKFGSCSWEHKDRIYGITEEVYKDEKERICWLIPELIQGDYYLQIVKALKEPSKNYDPVIRTPAQVIQNAHKINGSHHD